ncbi:MAG: hypothetical protein AB1442_17965, partial [Nitrospirota bacterium]
MSNATNYSKPALFMAVVLAVWLPGYAISFAQVVFRITDHYSAYSFALFGMLGAIAAFANVYSRYYKIPGYDAIAGSALFGLILGRKVNAVKITAKGVFYDCKNGAGGYYGNTLIHLAPYFFPGVSLAVAVFLSLFFSHGNPLIQFFVGFAFCFELIRAARETYLALSKQSADPTFRNIGTVPALIITLFFFLFFFGMVLSCLIVGSGGVAFFSKKWFFTSA